MSENLVIVESPAKAKTIEKILGSKFTVKSSFGHIRDLPKKGIGIDVDDNFSMSYEVSAEKKKVVQELKREIKSAKYVWLASDEDREGEAIAWHLADELGLDINMQNRIVFHEITSTAINNAIKNPRTIDINLVNAQQARRALDRLVGFELSPVLWRKVKPSLSAGRVQSVAVKLIVEREREIIRFTPKSSYKVNAIFFNANGEIKTELHTRFDSEQETIAFIKDCVDKDFYVENVEKKPGTRSPSAPFTTSTLQQEASRKLGFSVSQTMRVAQSLYESGYITYMRTDSVNLSNDALGAISENVKKLYGENYLKIRKYSSKIKGAQEAHEAIRPTYFQNQKIDGTSQEQRLYTLIWNRTVASQMADARLERTTIKVGYSGIVSQFEAKGEVIVFDGFLKLYDNGKDSLFLPDFKMGDKVGYSAIDATQKFEQKPSRYGEASLVKQLEELGIGRPSTYAPTISTIIAREYVIKEDREGVKRDYVKLVLEGREVVKVIETEIVNSEKSKLFPTDIGMIVNDYLQTNFPDILDYGFTATVENSFDEIAGGKVKWQKMLGDFYGGFHTHVVKLSDSEGGYANREARLLGVDDATGKNVYARMGRFGAMVQLGENDDTPKYAGLKANQLIETITLEDAMDLFKLPRTLGDFEDKTVVVGIGRFGAYVRHNSKFVSIPKELSPYEISFDEAVELIQKKRQSDIEKVLRRFPEDEKLFVLNGRFGAYIEYDGSNYKVDKDKRENLKDISFADAMEIVKTTQTTSKPKKSAAKGAKKSSATKSTTTKRASAKSSTTKKSTSAKSTTKRVAAKKSTKSE